MLEGEYLLNKWTGVPYYESYSMRVYGVTLCFFIEQYEDICEILNIKQL